MIEGIKNYLKFTNNVSSAGQPTRDELLYLVDFGFAAVINLALDGTDYSLQFERERIEKLGMEYVHIPVAFDQPDFEDYEAFKQTMKRLKGKKCFVHCAENKRVTVFLALYFIQEFAWHEKQAMDMIEQVWQPNPCWHQFFLAVLQHTSDH